MSFPPRPPMMPGAMPPMMPPFGYGGPMMPPNIAMNMMRPMMPPNPGFMMNLKAPIENRPVTTVFVGNICERAPDLMIRNMLQRCGNVLNWKRVQGTNGKLQAFGFCEYDNPESTLRCIRLLNGYEIAEKKLLVKVDQKTKELLSEHLKKTRRGDALKTKNAKKAAMLRNMPNKKSAEEEEEDNKLLNLELVDEDTLKEDRVVIGAFESILKQYAKDLNPEPVEAVQNAAEVATPANVPIVKTPSETQINVETKESTEKIEIKEKPKEDKDRRTVEKERIDKERDRTRRNNSPAKRSRTRSPDLRNSRPYRQRTPEFEPSHRSSSIGRQNSSRSEEQFSTNKDSRQTSNEDSEEVRERKRLERKLREKEMAYRERLKNWEAREEKKRAEYQMEKKKEILRKKALAKEAKKLKQFLEDYDDEKDDQVYFKGSNLEKKLKVREKEIESDNRDRQREREELEELKKRLVEKGLSDDVDVEAKKIQNDQNIKLKTKFDKLDQTSSSSEEESDIEDFELRYTKKPEENLSSLSSSVNIKQELMEDSSIEKNKNGDEIHSVENIEIENNSNDEKMKEQVDKSYNEKEIDNYNSTNSNSPDSTSSFIGNNLSSNLAIQTHSVTIKSMQLKKSMQPINQLFVADEEDTRFTEAQQKRAKLELERKQNAANAEERKKAVKKLVESIPTDRDELFAYQVDWEQLDEVLMEKRIRPWINKKIIEYIGEEEATLNDFICLKIKQRTKPEKLLEEVKVILDDEAELFIKKMWRLVVYETESKRCGLSK